MHPDKTRFASYVAIAAIASQCAVFSPASAQTQGGVSHDPIASTDGSTYLTVGGGGNNYPDAGASFGVVGRSVTQADNFMRFYNYALGVLISYRVLFGGSASAGTMNPSAINPTAFSENPLMSRLEEGNPLGTDEVALPVSPDLSLVAVANNEEVSTSGASLSAPMTTLLARTENEAASPYMNVSFTAGSVKETAHINCMCGLSGGSNTKQKAAVIGPELTSLELLLAACAAFGVGFSLQKIRARFIPRLVPPFDDKANGM